MERIIEIAVRGLNAVQTNDMEYVCDNTEYIAVFDFDAEWDGVDPKTARFVYGEEHQDIVFTGDRCEIPRISDVNSMRIGVFAGNLVTTTPAQVICRRSILGKSSLPADPAPDVYAQIMEVAFPAAVAAAEESAKQAAASEQNAKTSETNAEQSAKNAAESAENLSTAEKNAKESAEQAKTSETNAKTSEGNAKTSEGNAKTSENNAKASETSASGSASNANIAKENAEKAKTAAEAAATRAETARQGIEQFVSGAEQSASTATAAAQKAGQHEANAKTAEQNANTSAQNATQSASDAKTSADEAFAERTEARRLVDVCAAYSKSANNSANYASNAKTEIQKSEQNIIDAAGNATASAAVAAQSEQNAKTAENNAKASEQNAAASAESAAQTLQSIDVSKESAAASAAAAAQSAQDAKTSESNASASAQAAKTSEGNAKASETNAAQSATEAKQAAESVNLPTPTPETVGKAVVVNASGDGFTLGEAAGGGSGSGAQADWNAKEGEPGHILNKPFGDFETYIVPEAEITFAPVEELGGMNAAMIEFATTPVIGNEYIVKFGESEYNCAYIDVSGTGQTCLLGNLAVIGGDDTGEPFLVYVEDGIPVVIPVVEVTTALFSVRGVQAVPIAPEYAPGAVLLDFVEAGLPAVNTQQAVNVSVSPTYFNKLNTALEKGTVKVRFNLTASYSDVYNGVIGNAAGAENADVTATANIYSTQGGYPKLTAFFGNLIIVFNVADDRVMAFAKHLW